MLMSFDSQHVFVNYIKEILHNFNLPGCKIFDSQKDTIQYFESIKEDFETHLIIKNFKNERDSVVLFKKEEGECSFTWLSYYSYDEEILNITKNFTLRNNIYDSSTHKYLGDYLRYLRDYKDLNLMSLYNCYANIIDEYNNYKYLSIPVKYGETYTLGLVSEKKFEYIITTDDIEEIIAHPGNYSFTTLKGLSKNHFTLITVPKASLSEDFFDEENLKLILKLPITNASSIVCLEGDYTFNPLSYVPIQLNYENVTTKKDGVERIKYGKYRYEKSYTNWAKENKFVSNISLLKNISETSGVSHPFADRLVEYLISNVIVPQDKVGQNITRAKFNLYSKYFDIEKKYNLTDEALINSFDQEFLTTLRFKLLETVEKNTLVDINTEDLLGYVDKDIEFILEDERYPKTEEEEDEE